MPTPQRTINRVLARRVIHQGREYGLSLVEIKGREVRISHFETETASTVYYNGTLRILRQGAVNNEDWCRDGDEPLLIEE